MSRICKSLLVCSSFLALSCPVALGQEARDRHVVFPDDAPASARRVFAPPEDAAKRWEPVVDFSLKGGNERTLGTVSTMVPLAQDEDTLIFADLRSVVSDQDTFEGNVGIGARRIAGSVIAGGYAFWDTRVTEYDNRFRQVTAGAEVLGETWEARANVYVPLGARDKLAWTDPTTATLSGTRLYLQDGRVFETSLQGFDAEFGRSLPILENARGYLGYYSFHGDNVEGVRGYRARVEADIGDWVEIGAEKQFSRGSGEEEVFGEIRVRYPFDGWLKGSKRREAMSPLQRRMMTPIVRDIDVVTVARPKADPVAAQTVTGEDSNVYFVDNTAAAGGDGSRERPFNTLAAAQGAAGAYDTIYVLRGDGTTAGQNAGVVLDDAGQRLLGSGVALTVDPSKIKAPEGVERLGDLETLPLVNATEAPVITNTGGDGVTVQANNVQVQGITVSGASRYGIYALASGGAVRSGLRIEDMTVSGSGSHGILLSATGGGVLSGASLNRVTAAENTVNGLYLLANGAGSVLSEVQIENVNSSKNGRYGVFIYVTDNGYLSSSSLKNVTSTENSSHGIYFLTNGAGSTLSDLKADNISSDRNGGIGIYLLSQNGGQVLSPELTRLSLNSNTGTGLYFVSFADSTIENYQMRNVNAFENGSTGVFVLGTGGTTGRLDNGLIENIVTNNNGSFGFRLHAINGHHVGSAFVRNITANNNGSDGMEIVSYGVGSILSDLHLSDLIATGNASEGLRLFPYNNSTTSNALVDGVYVSGNGTHGLYINPASGGAATIKVMNVTAIGNNIHGVYVNDDTSNPVTIDLGGGALGSRGGNRIYGNTSQDIRVDLDGLELKAEGNWWGDPAGLQPGRTLLDDGSTIDADPFLTSDPD